MTHTEAWGYKLVQLKTGREWELIEDYTYERAPISITVREGFVYDGASIPRVFWRAIGPPAAGKYAHASLIHDWLYTNKALVRNPHVTETSISRKEADDLMLAIMKDDGVSWWRRNTIHRAVRLGGARAWRT